MGALVEVDCASSSYFPTHKADRPSRGWSRTAALALSNSRLSKIAHLFSLVVLVTCVSICTHASAQERIRVGVSDSPPISSRNPVTEELQGLAVSLFKQVAAEAGLDAQIEMFSFGALLPALTEMKVDVVTMSGTPERRRRALFSIPFARYGEALLARTEDATAYSGLEQLKGKRVGSNAGGGWIGAVEKAGAQIVTFPGAEQSLQALEKGDVDAIVGNAPTYTYLMRSAAFPHVRIVETYSPRQMNELAFGVRPSDVALLEQINRALQQLENRGVLQRLRTEWGF
jgi:ABC-type amino acid transport substrate-binding protein